MLKFYRVYVETYRGNELMNKYHQFYELLAEENSLVKEREIKITWDNLSEIYQRYGFYLPFMIYHFKKGRVLSFDKFSFFKKMTWDIREWKYPDPNLTIKLKIEEEEEGEKSISDILKWHNANEAIQYLTERGLSVFSEIKNRD